jgi:hypothetical protein
MIYNTRRRLDDIESQLGKWVAFRMQTNPRTQIRGNLKYFILFYLNNNWMQTTPLCQNYNILTSRARVIRVQITDKTALSTLFMCRFSLRFLNNFRFLCRFLSVGFVRFRSLSSIFCSLSNEFTSPAHESRSWACHV